MLRSNCEVDGVKNRCKKLVRENAVAQALGNCSYRLMGSWLWRILPRRLIVEASVAVNNMSPIQDQDCFSRSKKTQVRDGTYRPIT